MGERVSREMTTTRENINHPLGNAERIFTIHNEMMKKFRRAHAKIDTIDSSFVERVNWWAFVTVRMKIHDRNMQN